MAAITSTEITIQSINYNYNKNNLAMEMVAMVAMVITGVNYLNAKPSAQASSKERVEVVLYNITMEIAIVLVVGVLALVIGAQSALALTEYQSGLEHGMIDGKHNGSVSIIPYIVQPGKGFANQTKEFINGYVTGYCKITGNTSSVDFGQAIFNCMQGPSSADWRIPYHFEVLHSEFMSVYKRGFAEGVKDGHDGIYHQAKLRPYEPGFDDGYTDGWRSTCKEMGLDTGPDSGCELSMDAGTP